MSDFALGVLVGPWAWALALLCALGLAAWASALRQAWRKWAAKHQASVSTRSPSGDGLPRTPGAAASRLSHEHEPGCLCRACRDDAAICGLLASCGIDPDSGRVW